MTQRRIFYRDAKTKNLVVFGTGEYFAEGTRLPILLGRFLNGTDIQYRRNDNEQSNVLPLLGGHSSSSSLAIPVSFNIRHKRTMHAINVNFSSTSACRMTSALSRNV